MSTSQVSFDGSMAPEAFYDKLVPISPRAMAPVPGTARKPSARFVRRRGSPQQGHALEMLGHAVEYLVDSRMFLVEQRVVQADRDAMQILMKMSRDVFSECPEVVPLWTRVSKRFRWRRPESDGLESPRG